jgi:hypothetical protein
MSVAYEQMGMYPEAVEEFLDIWTLHRVSKARRDRGAEESFQGVGLAGLSTDAN